MWGSQKKLQILYRATVSGGSGGRGGSGSGGGEGGRGSGSGSDHHRVNDPIEDSDAEDDDKEQVRKKRRLGTLNIIRGGPVLRQPGTGRGRGSRGGRRGGRIGNSLLLHPQPQQQHPNLPPAPIPFNLDLQPPPQPPQQPPQQPPSQSPPQSPNS